MRIFVKVKPNAKVEKVEKVDDLNYFVSVKAPPTEGRANRAVVELIADYFKIPKSKVKIIAGFSSKNKVIEIEN